MATDKFGNITSQDYFILHELLSYSFYWVNRNVYRTAFDIGANLGMDSIMLNRFGYEVYAFEPDPLLCEMLNKNISLNQCSDIHVYQKAISDRCGIVDFVRVKGNTTASHILGARSFYGETECLKVEAITIQDIGIYPDLMTMNVEGYEKNIVQSIDYPFWEKMDALIEIHNEENAEEIFNYFSASDINIFSQKLGWQKISKVEEMPTTYKEGHIFVSRKEKMNWEEA